MNEQFPAWWPKSGLTWPHQYLTENTWNTPVSPSLWRVLRSHGWSKRAEAVGRCWGSFRKHRRRKSASSYDNRKSLYANPVPTLRQRTGEIFGGRGGWGSVTMLNIAAIADWLKYGGCPVINSMTTHPTLLCVCLKIYDPHQSKEDCCTKCLIVYSGHSFQ